MTTLAASARSAALAPLPGWLAFSVTGRDAVDLLGRLSSNDLAPLLDGRAVTTLFLTPTGRIRHRVLLVPDGSGLLAMAEPGSESLPEWIDTYTFAEDCRVTRDTREILLALGPEALERLAPLLATGAIARSGGTTWIRRDWGALPAAFACAAPLELDALRREAGLPILDAQALLQVRVEHGEPAAGAELTEDRFPLEAGLLHEISFTKGCYTGQEVVARQDTYGKVVRRLVALGFPEGSEPVPGDELASEGRGCTVTSVAPVTARTREGRRLRPALGYVSARSAQAGSEVTTAAGLTAVTCELPFSPG